MTSSSSSVNLRQLALTSRRDIRPVILSESIDLGTLYIFIADRQLSFLDVQIASIARMIRASSVWISIINC